MKRAITLAAAAILTVATAPASASPSTTVTLPPLEQRARAHRQRRRRSSNLPSHQLLHSTHPGWRSTARISTSCRCARLLRRRRIRVRRTACCARLLIQHGRASSRCWRSSSRRSSAACKARHHLSSSSARCSCRHCLLVCNCQRLQHPVLQDVHHLRLLRCHCHALRARCCCCRRRGVCCGAVGRLRGGVGCCCWRRACVGVVRPVGVWWGSILIIAPAVQHTRNDKHRGSQRNSAAATPI